MDENCNGVSDKVECGTCSDGKVEATNRETDVDCGGPYCGPCDVADACVVDGDCMTSDCSTGTCRVWARFAQGDGYDQSPHVAIDAPTGDVVVALDSSSGLVDVGTGNVPYIGAIDTVLARYAPDGTPRWSHRAGGADNDRTGDVAIRPDGSIVVISTVASSGGYSVDSTQVLAPDAAGQRQAVLTSFTASGAVEWAVWIGDPGVDDSGADVVALPNGDVVVALVRAGTVGVQASGDARVTQVHRAGGLGWDVNWTGTGGDQSRAIAYDPVTSDLIVGGYFGFSGGPSARTDFLECGKLDSTAFADGFVARIRSTDGACVWAVPVSGASDQSVIDVAVDGAVYAAALGYNTARFGTGPLVTGPAYSDVYVARLAITDGRTVWTKAFGGSDNDDVGALTTDDVGDPVLAMTYRALSTIGVPQPRVSGNEALIARLDASSGGVLETAAFASYGQDQATGVAVDPATGNVVAVGHSSGVLDFGAGLMSDTAESSYGQLGVWMADIGRGAWTTYDGLQRSCDAIHTLDAQSPTDLFLIDPTGGARTDEMFAWCDMTTSGGGWTRVYYNDGTLRVCGLATGFGSATVLGTQATPSSSAALPATVVDAMPWRGEVMLVPTGTSGDVYQVFRAPTNPLWRWSAIANGAINSVTAATSGVEVRRSSGGGFAPVRRPACAPRACLLGGDLNATDPPFFTMILGIGDAGNSGAVNQFDQSTCDQSTIYSGIMVGNPVVSWGNAGSVYVR